MQLRDYQQDAISRVNQAIASGKRHILLVAATGSGKTVIAASVMNEMAEQNKTSLFVAHRREIIHQTSDKLDVFDCQHGIILSGHRRSAYPLVQVASVQTFHARVVRGSSKPPQAEVVFIDEAHRSLARTYQEMADYYPDAIFIGLTATPCRGDGRGLGGFWEELIEVSNINDLIKAGYLVKPRYFAPSIPDLTGVKVRAGDYAKGELEAAMDSNVMVGGIVDNWMERANGRKTVVFTSGVARSKHIQECFHRRGIESAHIDGKTNAEERAYVLEQLEGGDIQVVCNSDVLTEGWNTPSVSCAVLARPTKSYGLYLQMAGRVLRTSEGKDDCILLDHSGAVYRHGFVEDAGGWSLDPDKKISEIRLEQAEKEPSMITCRECFTVYEKSDHCPNCGCMPTKQAKDVNMKEGRLREIKRKPKPKPMLDKQQIWNESLWRCIHRGLKVGAAAHMYRKKTGVWPVGLEVTPKGKAEWNLTAKGFYDKWVNNHAR